MILIVRVSRTPFRPTGLKKPGNSNASGHGKRIGHRIGEWSVMNRPAKIPANQLAPAARPGTTVRPHQAAMIRDDPWPLRFFFVFVFEALRSFEFTLALFGRLRFPVKCYGAESPCVESGRGVVKLRKYAKLSSKRGN